MSKTRWTAALALCTSLALVPASPARALVHVIDSANLVQNVLQVAREVEQVANQVTSLENEARMLANQARNLAQLDYSSLAKINGALSRIGGLMASVDRIAYQAASVEEAFAGRFGAGGLSGSDLDLLTAAHERWSDAIAAFRHALTIQADVVAAMPATQAELGELVTRSQGAVGILEATQAGNQLLAVQAKQLNDLAALVASQGRAQAVEAARQAAAEAQAQEQLRRFLEPGASYTPTPVQMFH